MFHLQDNENLDKWFQRLNAPLKRLPAEERANLHLEVRQHLEALAAANEELGSPPEEALDFALEQFGNPKQLGRRLQREALTLPRDPNRWDRNPLMAASAYAFVQCVGLLMASMVILSLIFAAMMVAAPSLAVSSLWSVIFGDSFSSAALAAPIWAGWITGSKMKREGVRGTFYALLAIAAPGELVSLCTRDFVFAAALVGLLGTGCLASWLGSRLRRIPSALSGQHRRINR